MRLAVALLLASFALFLLNSYYIYSQLSLAAEEESKDIIAVIEDGKVYINGTSYQLDAGNDTIRVAGCSIPLEKIAIYKCLKYENTILVAKNCSLIKFSDFKRKVVSRLPKAAMIAEVVLAVLFEIALGVVAGDPLKLSIVPIMIVMIAAVVFLHSIRAALF